MIASFCDLFFFSSRRRHTRYIGDWSSDVCSSDLLGAPDGARLIDGEPVPGRRAALRIEAAKTLGCADPEAAVAGDQKRIRRGMRQPLVQAIIGELVAVEPRQTLSCAKPQITGLIGDD